MRQGRKRLALARRLGKLVVNRNVLEIIKISYEENENGFIALLDSPDTIVRKVKRAVTDSEANIRYTDEQPGVKNLLDIYCSISEESIDKAVERFSSLGYGELKLKVAEAIVEELRPLQNKFYDKNKDYIDEILICDHI